METKCPICESACTALTSSLFQCAQCFWVFGEGNFKHFDKSELDDEKRNEYLAIVKKASSLANLKHGDKVLDISSGDGTLLGWYLKNTVTVGVESDASLMKEALNNKRIDVPVIHIFSPEEVKCVSHIGSFQVITIVDVFQEYDLKPLLTGCKELLSDTGVLVIQAPYLPQLLKERVDDFPLYKNYFLIFTLRLVCTRLGLVLRGVEIVGQNIRGYITHSVNKSYGTSDFDTKLKFYTTMSAAILQELHSRYDTNVPFLVFARGNMASMT